MATAKIPVPDVMQFKLDTEKQFTTTRHYNLIEGNETLSEKLNISVNRGFSKALYTYSVKKWTSNKWSKQLTGLFNTYDPYIFYGDTEDKKNLVLMRFANNGNLLKVYYFPGFYTTRITDFLKTLKDDY